MRKICGSVNDPQTLHLTYFQGFRHWFESGLRLPENYLAKLGWITHLKKSKLYIVANSIFINLCFYSDPNLKIDSFFLIKTLAFANFERQIAKILKFHISEEQKHAYNFEHLQLHTCPVKIRLSKLSQLDF